MYTNVITWDGVDVIPCDSEVSIVIGKSTNLVNEEDQTVIYHSTYVGLLRLGDCLQITQTCSYDPNETVESVRYRALEIGLIAIGEADPNSAFEDLKEEYNEIHVS